MTKAVGFFSENYFYKEFVYVDLKFISTGGIETALADLMINLEDIILAPRELVVPESISAKTLADMDRAVSNFKRGDVSPAIDLSDF